jgi:hypothetical protein
MRKGIAVRVQIYIEGDAAPADDFAKIGTDVAAKLFAAGVQAAAGSYNVTIKKIEPLEGSAADDDADERS